MMKIICCILFLFYFTQSFSQTEKDSIVYIEKCDFQDCIHDTIVFYNDSTFKIDIYAWLMSGLEHRFTRGRFSLSDSLIILNSFIEYKRSLIVKEDIDSNENRVYEWNYDSTSVYYGRSGFIIELDENKKQYLDTLFFYTTEKFNLESLNKNSFGFVIYVSGEFAGKYLFTNCNSNKITVWFSDYNYFKQKKNIYLEDYVFIIVNNKTLKYSHNGRFLLRD